jgi:phage shock protein E
MTRRSYIILGLVILAVGAIVLYVNRCDASCKAQTMREETQNFSHIIAQSFADQLAGGVVIDVRTPEEYVTGHMANAMLLDISAPDFKQRIGKLDRNVPYYVYCRSGNRSRTALEIMKIAGFAEVYGLEGGIIAWQKEGFGVE